jgi:hypothetical protein
MRAAVRWGRFRAVQPETIVTIRRVEEYLPMRRKKPDLIMALAVLIGLGVLVTELTHGQAFASQTKGSSVSR